MHLHLDWFSIFQGKLRSIIVKSYFCNKKKTKNAYGGVSFEYLAQEETVVNSRYVQWYTLWQNFHMCVCTV